MLKFIKINVALVVLGAMSWLGGVGGVMLPHALFGEAMTAIFGLPFAMVGAIFGAVLGIVFLRWLRIKEEDL